MRLDNIKRAIRLQLPPQHFSDAGPFLGSRQFEALPNILPVVTYSFVLISAVLFFLTDIAPTDNNITGGDKLTRLGFRDHFNIILRDWWGVFTAIFFHGSIIHIGFNCMALISIGGLLERGLGSLRTLFLYLLFGALSFIYQILISELHLVSLDSVELISGFYLGGRPFSSSLGLSGVIFAVIGFMWGSWKRWTGFLTVFNLKLLQFVGFWQLLCFAMTWTGVMNIANTAHISGLAFGFCVGMWFCYGFKEAKLWASLAIASILLAIGGLIFYHFHFSSVIQPYLHDLENANRIVPPLF